MLNSLTSQDLAAGTPEMETILKNMESITSSDKYSADGANWEIIFH